MSHTLGPQRLADFRAVILSKRLPNLLKVIQQALRNTAPTNNPDISPAFFRNERSNDGSSTQWVWQKGPAVLVAGYKSASQHDYTGGTMRGLGAASS